VNHRPLALLGVATLTLVLAAPALAVRVHVRVEGATTTIFGATEPRLTPVTGTFAPPAGEPVTVNAATPLGALERASRRGEFYYRLETFAVGAYVAQVGRRAGSETTGWVYKVNGVSPPVGADAYELKEGDRVLWYFARFGSAGGPKTLHIERTKNRTCFQAVIADDNGRTDAAVDVVFRVDGRTRRSANGGICVRRHWHTLRATKAGVVRSQVVTRPRLRPAAVPALAGRA
jgi:hypothetical protein